MMSKTKIKIFTIALIFGLVGIVMSSSHFFPSEAKSDNVLSEIANYKTWSKLTKEPIKVKENTFIIDGQEVENFRTGTLNG